MTARFDTVLMVDWSGGNDRGATPKKDAIWAALVREGRAGEPIYLRNRQVAEAWLRDVLKEEQGAGRRVLAGFDFPFGYPAGVAARITGRPDPFALWDWLEARIEDSPKANNRWQLAAEMNARFPGTGPFWGNGGKMDVAGLPRRGREREGHGAPELREVERIAKGTFSVWQLAGAGAVGSQVLMGLPVLNRLRRRFGASVWPFDPPRGSVVMAEIWPSLLAPEVRAQCARTKEIRDAVQVRLMARAFARLPEPHIARMLATRSPEEGWILGLGFEEQLRAAL